MDKEAFMETLESVNNVKIELAGERIVERLSRTIGIKLPEESWSPNDHESIIFYGYLVKNNYDMFNKPHLLIKGYKNVEIRWLFGTKEEGRYTGRVISGPGSLLDAFNELDTE